jgi:hypothetical protein
VVYGSSKQNKRTSAISVAKVNATGCGITEGVRPTELASPHQIASGVHIKKIEKPNKEYDTKKMKKYLISIYLHFSAACIILWFPDK